MAALRRIGCLIALAVQPSGHDIGSITASLADAGVDVVVLGGESGLPAVDADRESNEADRTLQLLIPKSHRDAALRVLEPLDWRYSWVRGGLLRLLPMSYYWWDGGAEVELYWSLPAAPLPSFVLSALTREIRRTALPAGARIRRPDPAALLVHLAVQACRPGRAHADDWMKFKAARMAVTDLTPVHALARRTRVSRSVRTALAAADAGAGRPERGAVYDGILELAWRVSNAVQARARPRRFKRLLAGTPWFGDTAVRCRVGAVEVTAGQGVFVPSPDADLFVEVAGARLSKITAPTVIEVGTGCGAIALALAHARPEAEVVGTELSPVAVRWAKRNARQLGLGRVHFFVGSLLDAVPSTLHGRVDLIIANLPYFPARDYMAIGSVPRDTIQGSGDDGLDLIRGLARDAIPFLAPGGGLLLQMFAWQWEAFSAELVALGYRPGVPHQAGAFVVAPADFVDEAGAAR